MNDASRLPIVLCCAEESEVVLVEVVDALHREGFAPEVLPGVELDASLVTAAADRMRGLALFVLCQSDDLDRFQVRRLEGLFSARKGPLHQMITVELPQRHPTAIAGEIRKAAQQMIRGSARADHDDAHNMRDVVMPTSVSAVPGAVIPPRQPRTREPGRDSKAAAAAAAAPSPEARTNARAEAGPVSVEAAGDADKAVVDLDELERLRPQPATGRPVDSAPEVDSWSPGSQLGDGVPLEVPEDFPVVGESSQDVEVRRPRRVRSERSGPIDHGERPRQVDPRAETDDRPLPSASSPIDIGDPAAYVSKPPSRPRGPRVLLLLVAATGMTAVVGMAVLHATAPMRPGPAEVSVRGVPQDEAEHPAPGGASGAEADREPSAGDGSIAGSMGDAGSEGSTSGGEGTTAEATTGADVASTEPAGSSGDGTEGTSDDVMDGTSDAGASGQELGVGEPIEPTEPGLAKVVPPPPTAGTVRLQQQAVVDAALADGRLVALDELLVLSLGPETTTWDEAFGRCKRRKLDGVMGWRLPSKAQLAKLHKAKLLAAGSYWSRSEVGGDEVYVLDSTTGRMNQYLKVEPNARVLCVRKRP
ncbi:hypothetical protein [Paraliomyxa miuraensis]|uniref:hypothetical protein n=1 Tax=Paraliomyxa miuraensis TaxID=376150 RepID=UPI00225844D0|nr:hypothetical protein [Paraliomyxa miuraensis]MCX4244952.1 hypothetical protein [Paraliomyxa miuraensis]